MGEKKGKKKSKKKGKRKGKIKCIYKVRKKESKWKIDKEGEKMDWKEE